MALSRAIEHCYLRTTLVDGANATAITLTGIATEDTILWVGHWTPGATADLVAVTANITITAADEITCSADYSSDYLWVWWVDRSGGTGQRCDYTSLRFDLLDGHATTKACTGITTEDDIAGALHITTKADTQDWAEYTSSCSITTDGYVDFGTDTTNDLVLVIWVDRSGAGASTQASSKFGLRFDLVAGGASTSTVTGIATEDEVLFVMRGAVDNHIAVITDVTSLASISAANTVAWSSSTASSLMLVVWVDRSL